MTERELIAAIAEDTHDETAWSVYTDWLLERGDPRAELVRLGHRTDANASRLATLLAHSENWVSPRLAALLPFWDLEWERGFIRDATLRLADGDVGAAIRALCSDPHAALTLNFRAEFPSIDAIARAEQARRTMRRPPPYVARPMVELGDLELSRLLRLETLRWSGFPIHDLHLPKLRILGTNLVECPALTDDDFDLPELVTLRLSWVERAQPLDKLLGTPSNLRTLELRPADPLMIEALVDGPLLRQLHTLTIAIADPSPIIWHASAFAALRYLTIEVRDESYDLATLRARFGRFAGHARPR